MKHCPRCHRLESDTSECIMLSMPGFVCPPLVAENPETDITISCGPCGFTRVVGVSEILHGLSSGSGIAKDRALPLCSRGTCAAKVLQAEPIRDRHPELPKKAPSKPAKGE